MPAPIRVHIHVQFDPCVLSVPCMHRAVGEWLANNNVILALEAALGDPSLAAEDRAALRQALGSVAAFNEKVVGLAQAPEVHKTITVYLKLTPARPSFGALHLDLDGTTTTVADLVSCCAELLRHEEAAVHLETTAGKPVVPSLHGAWSIASISRNCVLNCFIQK